MFRFTRIGSLALAMLLISFAAVVAKERPHFFRGSGQLNPMTGGFTSSGIATHLGKFTEQGVITSMDEVPGQPGLFIISGWAIFKAADGDELHETFDGQLNLGTGEAHATITYIPGGTGRFANASGTATLNLQLDLNDFSFTYSGRGVLDF